MRPSFAIVPALAVLLAACASPAQTSVAPSEAGRAEETTAAAAPDVPASDTASPSATPAPDPLPAVPAEGKPVVPEDAVGLATVLTAAEQAIRDPGTGPGRQQAAGVWQQAVYRKLAQRPELVEPVIALLPAGLHGAVRGNVHAGERLAAMHSPAKPAAPGAAPTPKPLPKWRIVAPPPPDELKGYYQEAQAATGVHWTYLAAVNLVETRMGRIRGDSVAGAQGPMQFMPATWGEWGEGDVNDHRDAIMAAGRFLNWGGMPEDPNRAIFKYNRDQRYVDAVRTYAEQMQADERAFYGYYHWQVYYSTGVDSVWLREGYDGTTP